MSSTRIVLRGVGPSVHCADVGGILLGYLVLVGSVFITALRRSDIGTAIAWGLVTLVLPIVGFVIWVFVRRTRK
ncbi:PLDc N-terminal domain-containing protein [Corynebacterium sp. TAE3-ERU12]|uniref:PLDc N-terminal domain-containing protein n=1 Tax=Corynebacterium sp. TAE3-ERU12 TaxID=2849491 RepID=UPI001C44B216|nr:PLDc N-terminal domain-containing protein [Corynebacterium sp. TAE3-ERU12]